MSVWWSLLPAAIVAWVFFCIWRTNKQHDEVGGRILALQGRGRDHLLSWAYEEHAHIPPTAHCWRLLTFRNPWVIYGPIVISLAYDYLMDQEFEDYYRWVYGGGALSYYQRRAVRKKMVGVGWRRTQKNGYVNPLSVILSDYRVADYIPSEAIHNDLSDAANEYDEIMKMQEALGM